MALGRGYLPSASAFTTRLARNTIVRYRKNIVSAEHSALIMFTATAACILSVNMVKKRAMSWNTGFPGGWPTSSL